LRATTVLTPVPIAREKEGVRHLATEPPGHVNEPHQADDMRARQSKPLRAHYSLMVGFYDLRLAVDNQPERAPHGHHRQGLERCVQCQTTYDQALLQSALL
jgi:hypothetical protein